MGKKGLKPCSGEGVVTKRSVYEGFLMKMA
jgi:hypothetical protein